jgi:uncharacterized protein with GYD domain
MQSFLMQTRLAPEAFRFPRSLEDRERKVMNRIRADCPGVRWIKSYVVLGPCDYIDLFEAPDVETATRVSAIVRTFGNATTEVWPLTPWERFKEIARGLPAEADWHAVMSETERDQLVQGARS